MRGHRMRSRTATATGSRTQAAGLTDQDERRTRYGELLSTCAGCHALVRRHRNADGPR